jgi:hypothetical protein
MFSRISGFESVNVPDESFSGDYINMQSHYASANGFMSAVMSEYLKEGSSTSSVIELVVVLPNSDVLYRDFLLLPDLTWRDSYGGIENEIEELLPSELFDLRLVSRSRTPYKFEF